MQAQTARIVPGHTTGIPAVPTSAFGASLSILPNIDGDAAGIPEYLIGSPGAFAPMAGIGSGQAFVFTGGPPAPGTTTPILATYNGNTNVTCSPPAPLGEGLGTQVTMVPDMDGLGLPDFVVTVPGRGIPGMAGGMACTNVTGGFDLISSETLAPIFQATGVAGETLGTAVSTIGIVSPTVGVPTVPGAGLPAFAVCGTNAAGISFVEFHIDGSNTPIRIPGVTCTNVASAGDWDGLDGADLAVQTASGGIQIVAPFIGVIDNVLLPFGSNFGFSMPSMNVPGTPSRLALGDPLAAGTAGSIRIVNRNGLIATFNGSTPGDQLGFSIASGGDVNGDLSSNFVIGAPGNGGQVFVSDPVGNLAARPITSPGSVFFGAAVAIVGQQNSDAFADVLIADPGLSVANVFFGGPDAQAIPFGTSCTPGSVTGPALSLLPGNLPIIGAGPSLNFRLTGATPGASVSLLMGSPNTVGVPLPCGSLFLQGVPIPVSTAFSSAVNTGGAWAVNPPAFSPLGSAGFLGFSIAFQGVGLVPGPNGTTFEVTNGINLVHGW